jgi:peptide-methionine (S)-S-oxide reductase
MKTLLFVSGVAVAMLLAIGAPATAEEVRLTPRPAVVVSPAGAREVAIFAGGCFWGVEGVFEHVRGVASATSGYAGGKTARPDYENVSAGGTGHAEAVRVVFDPRVVRYADLLQIYFSVVADPTTLNRQGPDSGTQYRTALFPTSAAQERQARAYIAQLRTQKAFERPIVTRIESLHGLTGAEIHHQDFMAKNPAHPYILRWDRPKVAGLKRLFPARYRP